MSTMCTYLWSERERDRQTVICWWWRYWHISKIIIYLHICVWVMKVSRLTKYAATERIYRYTDTVVSARNVVPIKTTHEIDEIDRQAFMRLKPRDWWLCFPISSVFACVIFFFFIIHIFTQSFFRYNIAHVHYVYSHTHMYNLYIICSAIHFIFQFFFSSFLSAVLDGYAGWIGRW